MSPKQQRFVDEYLLDLNATQAAIRSGYSAKTAEAASSRLLRNVKVASAIASAQKSRAERTEITADLVLRELAKIGFSDMRKLLKWGGTVDGFDETEAEESGEIRLSVVNIVQLFDSGDLDDDTAACISEVSQTKDGALKVKLHDKQAALVSIGRHLGMFNDKVQVEVVDPFAVLEAMTQNERRLRTLQ